MSMIYTAPFDARAFGSITLATVGETDAVVQLADVVAADEDAANSHWFWHSQLPALVVQSVQTDETLGRFRKFSQTSFAAALEAALEAQMGGWTTPNLLAITIDMSAPDTTLPTYTIAWPVANFSITFSNAATRALLGFTGNVSGAQTYTGTVAPTYLFVPTIQAGSDPSCEYEASEIGTHVSSDQGQGYGMSREMAPLCFDWTQQFETKEKTFKSEASATHPWVQQHLFEYCRGRIPFAVYGGGFGFDDNRAFYLRSEGTRFEPLRASPGNDSQFHVRYLTEVGGYFVVGV